jgi:hypothetical protein
LRRSPFFALPARTFGDGNAEFSIWTVLGRIGHFLPLRSGIRGDTRAPTGSRGVSKEGCTEERCTEER